MPSFEFPRLAAFAQRARHALEAPRVPFLCAVVAALLTASSLPSGLATEDWVFSGTARGPEFSFFRRVNLFGPAHPLSPTEISKRFEEFHLMGFWPWLTDERLDVSFFRPLSSFTHVVDFRLLSAHPWVMHAENVAWYAALAALVAALYRRLDAPGWIAGGAALLYAADDAHGHAVGWLINRNAIMAAVFGVLALVAHDAFRKQGRARHAVATAICLGLSLLSAEYGLSVTGYFLAYTLVYDEAPWRKRLGGAVPWMLTLLVWALAYRALGHGVRGSGLYVDPLTAPGQFVSNLVEHASLLLTGQLAFPFSDTFSRGSRMTQGFLTFWAVVFLWTLAWVCLPLLGRDRKARFWAVGSLLSVPPACSTFPEDRLLFFVGLGAMPFVVRLVEDAVRTRDDRTVRGLASRAVAALLLVVHAVVGPALLPFRSRYMARYEARLDAARTSAFEGAKSRVLILVNGEDFYFTSMMAQTRHARGESRPDRVLVLSGTAEPVEVHRRDESTLDVTPRGGFFSREFNRIYRSPSHALRRGDRLDLDGVQATVLDTDALGEPTRARFHFDVPLDAEGYLFRQWNAREGVYRAFRLPAVGASVTVGADS